MDVITRNCPRCNAPLNVGPQQTRLDCGYCGCAVEVVRRNDRQVELAEHVPAEPRLVPCPASLHIDEQGGGLTIWWRWFQPMLIFLVFFCLAWNAFLFVWYGIVANFGGMAPWPLRLLMFVFPLGHVAVGVGLSYFTLAGLFNRTRVRVEGGTLSVWHGPVPWQQPLPVRVDEIDDIYVTRSSEQSEKNRGYGYAINVLDTDGGRVELIKRLTDSEKALCIADRLRRHLNKEHGSVPGEFTG